MTTPFEQRRYKRAPINKAVVIEHIDGEIINARCYDISEGGLGFIIPYKPPFTGKCHFIFNVPSVSPTNVSLRVEAMAEIKYCNRLSGNLYRIGAEFKDVSEETLNAIREFVATQKD